MVGMSQRHGLARALSKLGFCSRSAAEEMVRAGRVTLNGVITRNPDAPTDHERDAVEVNGRLVSREGPVYLMLNKPRGYVTSASDELGRETVFDLLPAEQRARHLFAVGRLDKASEGLLLLTNDTAFAARLTDPESHVDKVYHVQINQVADDALLARMERGVDDLRAKKVTLVRHGEKTCWLEVTLDEGKNRHIRRLLEALKCDVLRLLRVRVGRVELGSLPKGECRALTANEVRLLGATPPASASAPRGREGAGKTRSRPPGGRQGPRAG
jgi:23S rRNA pseudouridine2605 synthase